MPNVRHKIAVILSEDLEHCRGSFWATHNRIKHLIGLDKYDITVYNISNYFPWYIRLIKKRIFEIKYHSINEKIVDGINYNVLTYPLRLVDYFLEFKLHRKPIFKRLYLSSFACVFKNYDLILCHNVHYLASEIYRKYNIQYIRTWHGSDIHTIPFLSTCFFLDTNRVIKKASYNIFVSKALAHKSDEISNQGKKIVLYNGVSEKFNKNNRINRNTTLAQYGVDPSNKIVAFVGNLYEIKNPLSLPEIFKQVYNEKKCVEFLVVGDGEYLSRVERLSKGLPIHCIGAVSGEDMPNIMASIDVLVLPSFNEGLPLVTLEALASGTNVVGSNVGGIAEAIGKENTFDLDESFIFNISMRIVQMISEKVPQELSSEFNWQMTATKESELIDEILDCK